MSKVVRLSGEAVPQAGAIPVLVEYVEEFLQAVKTGMIRGICLVGVNRAGDPIRYMHSGDAGSIAILAGITLSQVAIANSRLRQAVDIDLSKEVDD